MKIPSIVVFRNGTVITSVTKYGDISYGVYDDIRRYEISKTDVMDLEDYVAKQFPSDGSYGMFLC